MTKENDKMMKKKEIYTNITPLPSFIPRQLVLSILHSHGEIITLNPLVLSHHAIPSPRDAPAEEYYSTWYEIFERIQIVPGTGKLGSGKISFRGCFHDVPWGVQTHIYAPMGIDLRHNYRVAGNQPGEPPEHREIGINAPSEGLYLREDIEIRCNFTMTGFVKSQLKSATKVLVDRLIKKAELLDAGVLKAMMDEGGRLKTVNPADRSLTLKDEETQQLSPMFSSPPMYHHQHSHSHSHSFQYQPDQKQSPTSPTSVPTSAGKSFTTELPGDTSYYHQNPTSSQQHQYQHQLKPPASGVSHRDSYQSSVSSNPSNTSAGGWSPSSNTHYFHDNNNYNNNNQSRPTSYSGSSAAMTSPPPQFAVELPATKEETVTTSTSMNPGLGMNLGQAGNRPQEWNIPAPGSRERN